MNIKANKILLMTVLCFSLFQISSTNQFEKVKELLKFCKFNGHKYVTMLDQNVSHIKANSLLLNVLGGIRSQLLVTKEQVKTSVSSNLDMLIIQKDNSFKFEEIFSIISAKKPQKVILILNSNEVEEFKKSIKGFGQNSYFYLLEISLQPTSLAFEWFTIMTFNHDSQFIMNKIQFDHLGNAIENYDLHGYNIVATGLTWKPSLAAENCDKFGKNCDIYGMIPDLMNNMAKQYNFTWDIYADIDNDWGMFPIEGPFNTSGKWKGVLGDVVTGKYQLSVNAWKHFLQRNEILDFVPIMKTATILCFIPKPPEVDSGLFIRPFTNSAWKTIGIVSLIGILVLIVPYFFIKDWENLKAYHIIELSLWSFFVLLNAYYGGALTMFFVSEITVPFETLRDVLKVFPEWNLVFMDGVEAYFKLPADQGDPDFVKFWSAVKSEGGFEKHVMANVKAGIEELKKGQTVMFAQTDVLRGAYQEDPKSIQGIKLFGVSVSEYYQLIFTKNSPLVPLFNQATTRLFENGQFLRTDFKWQGNKIKDEGAVDILILTSGQVFLIYAILAFFLGLSIIFLTFECCYKKFNGSDVKKGQNEFELKTATKPSLLSDTVTEGKISKSIQESVSHSSPDAHQSTQMNAKGFNYCPMCLIARLLSRIPSSPHRSPSEC